MAHHRIYRPDLNASPGEELTIEGEEARHAVRVKRLEPGQEVELLNGRGRVVTAIVSGSRKQPKSHGWELVLRAQAVEDRPQPRPRLEVWTAVPKGARLEEMIDQLSQAGAWGWAPLSASRSVVDPREGKLQRLAKVAAESAKQCGRAWSLEVLPGGPLGEGLSVAGTIMADAAGEPYAPDPSSPVPEQLRLLVGPEGGWTAPELELARRAGANVCSFGTYVMRLETAAVVGAGIVLEAFRRRSR
jgi:16S rRNA (uracil1498-N3)-methyltransferase